MSWSEVFIHFMHSFGISINGIAIIILANRVRDLQDDMRDRVRVSDSHHMRLRNGGL